MNYYKINILNDNFVWVLEDNLQAIIVDCGDSIPVLNFLKNNNFNLTHILLTHAHSDHINGLKNIKQYTNAKVIASNNIVKFLDANLIDIKINYEQNFTINNYIIQPIFTPGHSEDHIAYFLPKNKWLFSGDTLFTLGCGKAFYDIDLLFNSLQKLTSLLPGDTLIFPGHNYLKGNLNFLDSLNYFMLKDKNKVQAEQTEIPSSLEFEKNYNPFLNYHNQEFKNLLDKKNLSNIDFFKYLRYLKNNY